MLSQVYVLILIFVGVFAVTYGDMIMAQRHDMGFFDAIWFPFVLNVVGVLILLVCYYYGYKNTKSIWQVSIVYVCAIALMQPLLAYAVLQNIPTIKQMIGFLFGIVGVFLII